MENMDKGAIAQKIYDKYVTEELKDKVTLIDIESSIDNLDRLSDILGVDKEELSNFSKSDSIVFAKRSTEDILNWLKRMSDEIKGIPNYLSYLSELKCSNYAVLFEIGQFDESDYRYEEMILDKIVDYIKDNSVIVNKEVFGTDDVFNYDLNGIKIKEILGVQDHKILVEESSWNDFVNLILSLNFSASALDNINKENTMKAKARFFANSGDIVYISSKIIPEGIAYQQELDGTVAVKVLKDTSDLLFVPVEIITSGEKIEVPAVTDDVSNFSRKVDKLGKVKNFETDPTDPAAKPAEVIQAEIKKTVEVATVTDPAPTVEVPAAGVPEVKSVSTATESVAPVQTSAQEAAGDVVPGDPVIETEPVQIIQDKQIEGAVIAELDKTQEPAVSKEEFAALKSIVGKNWVD